MKNIAIKTFCTSIILAMFSWQVQATIEDEIEKTFDVEVGSHFSLDNINGSVEIKSWDQQVIKVLATIKADDQQGRDRISIDIQQSGQGVKVETRYKNKSSWGKNHHSGGVSYHVMVPEDIDLSSINLVNGSLTIENVHGNIKVDLVNGSVKAIGLMGDSEINSVNGSIKAIYHGLNDNFEKIDINTVNGSIKLSLPEGVSAAVNAETMHGSIANDFGLSVDKNLFSGKNIQGDIGSGDARISLASVNGSIKIMKK